MTNLLTKIIADFSTTLTTKTAVGATTATLTSGLDADGVQLPTATYGFTIDRNNANKEYFTATLTGANLTAIKTVTRGTGAGTSGLVKTHRKGAEVIISDWVAMKRMLDVLDGTSSFDSATPLGYDGTATISTANQFATKAYADGLAIAGSPDATTTTKGITKMSVAPASAASPIAVGDNDPRVPTQAENDALVGTSGAPSTSNKYVTNDDTAVTATASKIVRANASNKIDPNYVQVTDIQAFTTAGATSWTKPSGAKFVEVHVFGAGGGGGGASAGLGASGAGGGGYGFKSFVASALGSTENLTVGAKGTGGAPGANGNAGTASSFGTTVYLKAQGGGGGIHNGTGGAGGSANGERYQTGGNGGNIGAQGADTSSDISPRGGGAGSFAGGSFTTNFVLSGGATGNPPTAGTTGSTTLIYGGTGGGGSNNVASPGAIGGNIGGGGGAGIGNGSSSSAGAAGGDGAVIVVTYF